MKAIQELYAVKKRPLKVLQFGEGNFLRAFVDYAIDVANEKGVFNSNVAIVVPIKGCEVCDRFSKQNNVYTVCLRGKKNGQVYEENRPITCINQVVSAYDNYEAFIKLAHTPELEFVVSNTTEAGIVYDSADSFESCPPMTFPGKLTKFLYERFTHFKGDITKGLTMLPVELIEKNGEALEHCVLQFIEQWQLPAEFKTWVTTHCRFVGTLVDRIVTGYPHGQVAEFHEQLGYTDELIAVAEPFGLWVIGDEAVAPVLPLSSDKLEVEFTNQLEVYKERKVRILNGAHTSMVLGAYLAGFDYVNQCMDDLAIRTQLEQSVFEEIVPTVHMPREKAVGFAREVFGRFENPFVQHALLSISLNSISKWRARVLPTFKDYVASHKALPKWLTYSLAALLAFYRTTEQGEGCLMGHRGETTYEIHDDADKLAVVATAAALDTKTYALTLLQREDFWGEDLTQIPRLAEAVVTTLLAFESEGIGQYIAKLGEVK
ncbi:tagaturonate reductase [Veillonella sp. R32]|uniref:tagaturonate reductase n=1 Tax=Veillonella sp. R32 TaxID=2021312 RepID=UPI00138A1560|nr:tagaturonate reductase [Veillonella sp. R32]KAF1683515.1 altronate oxidoreductase [Veillonella sp. R32]